MAKSDEVGWKIVAGVGAAVASSFARKTVERGYKSATGKLPPQNPEDPDVDLKEAVIWAVVTGVAIGLSRLFVQRAAAGAWLRSRGELPPGLKKDDQQPAT